MADQFWLIEIQLKRIEPHFPKSRGVPRLSRNRSPNFWHSVQQNERCARSDERNKKLQ